MMVKSRITGKRLVSMPFSDHSNPLLEGTVDSENMINKFITLAQEEKVKYIECRSTKNTFPFETQKFRADLRHVLALNKSEKELLVSFSENTRRNIKKAIKSKLIIKIHNNAAGMNIFYRMMCETRRKHGLPPQPKIFFMKYSRKYSRSGNGRHLIRSKRWNLYCRCHLF